jgi:tetratricopeptide (TPR) repeat protein
MADKDETELPAGSPKPVHIGGESLADRILPHIKKILVTFVLAAVVISAFLVFRWRKQVGQERETEKLAEVLSLARRPVGADMPVIPGAPAQKSEPKFATAKERAEAVLAEMAKQGADGNVAWRASLLLDAGKLDEAIAEYRKGQTAVGIDGVLAREGLGIALETKALAEKDPGARQKLLEEALSVFTTMQPDAAGVRHVYALYHQGRLQLTLGKTAEAKALLEKAKELGSSTDLAELIERRLAQI